MTTLPSYNPFNAMPVWMAPNPTPQILTHIAAASSVLICTGQGWIADISVNTAAGFGSLTVYDGVDATGAVIAVIDASKNAPTVGFSPWRFNTGLFVVLSAKADITIVAHLMPA